MSRLARILLFTLVASWLPVTLHCKLEAAGVSHPHDTCAAEQSAAASDSACRDDACPTVEDALFKESAPAFKISAPAAIACYVCLARIPLALASDEHPSSVLSPARQGPPPAWRVAWQFLTRAAPPARAPSLHT